LISSTDRKTNASINIKILLTREKANVLEKSGQGTEDQKIKMCQLGNLFCGFGKAPLNQRL